MPPAERRLHQPADPPFRFTHVPAELRERVLEALKARPEFTEAWQARIDGPTLTLSLHTPQPIEFCYEGHRFLAFAWMGEIYVLGEQEPFQANP